MSSTPSTEDVVSKMLDGIKKQVSKMDTETIRNNILNRVFMMNVIGSNILQKLEGLEDNSKCKECSYLLSLYNVEYHQINEQTNGIFDIMRKDFDMNEDAVDVYTFNLSNISNIIGRINQIDTSLLEKKLIDYEHTIQYDLSRMHNIRPH